MQLFAIAIAAAAATSPLAQAAAVPSSSASTAFTWRQAGCVASSSRSSSHASSSTSSSAVKSGWTEHCLDRCGALSPNRYAMVSTSGSHSRCACPDEMPEGAMTLTAATCSSDEAVVYVREPTVAPARTPSAAAKSSSWSFSLTGAASKLFRAILPSSSPLPAEPIHSNGDPASPIVSVLESRAEALSSDIHDLLTTIASHELALRSASSEEEQLHDMRMVYILEEQLEEVLKERRRVKRAARRLARADLLGMRDDVVRAVEDMYVGPLLDSWRADERSALEVDIALPADDDDEEEEEEEEAWVFQPIPSRYGRKRLAH